ncbi:hypothetical protein C8A05DRAFT_33834 [Staphylotrichum tortipilum]|uniref:Aminoglycoside phosphotransferase domain-containing protein n=1 Tax=Staphylotrichum tortipilum TaxID=2831512 RepID=A0AAN6MM28_9PEZI|nr:hypothetical protein C8A05DRAFT_33834 [Staphylotrichum longicolle]
MPRHTRHDGGGLQFAAGQVLWLPPQHQVTVDITSFHGTDLNIKYPHSTAKRKKYLPISPADPHPDLDGALLTLTNNDHLPKKSWVNLAQSHTVPAAAFRPFQNYALTRGSYRLLVQHAAAPTSGHRDAVARSPRPERHPCRVAPARIPPPAPITHPPPTSQGDNNKGTVTAVLLGVGFVTASVLLVLRGGVRGAWGVLRGVLGGEVVEAPRPLYENMTCRGSNVEMYLLPAISQEPRRRHLSFGGRPAVDSRFFYLKGGPFASEAAYNDFLVSDLVRHASTPTMIRSQMRDDHDIVLTHGDLHAINILAKPGSASSGPFYPADPTCRYYGELLNIFPQRYDAEWLVEMVLHQWSHH